MSTLMPENPPRFPSSDGGPTLHASDLAALVETHADFVFRSVRRLGVPDAGADDATQQVFLVAQSKLDQIQMGRERAFLFAVAIHTAAHVRRTLARRREVDDAETAYVADGAPLPDEELDQRRARALLDEVLDAMPIDLRPVFVMAELEEMTMAEIAEILGLAPGTVASRLRRARGEFHEQAKRTRARLQHRAQRPPGFHSSTTLAVAGRGVVR